MSTRWISMFHCVKKEVPAADGPAAGEEYI